MWYLSFKLKWIYLFSASCIFFHMPWLTKGCQEISEQLKCGWIKEIQKNLRNFRFRNSFCLYKNCNLLLKLLRDLIAMDSWFKLTSRQQPMYSTKWNFIILFLSYIFLYSNRFLPYWKESIQFFSTESRDIFINKSFSHNSKFFVLNIFDFCNVLMLIKDTNAVSIQRCMTIWQSLRNIIFI